MNEKLRWAYTFILLGVTVGWAAFCVVIVKDAAREPTAAGVLEAAGVSVLLGALIGWVTLTVQFFFRKRPKP